MANSAMTMITSIPRIPFRRKLPHEKQIGGSLGVA